MQLLLFALCSLVPGFTLASNPNDINPALAPRQQEEEQKALAHLDRDPFFRSPHEHPFHYQRRQASHYHRFTHPDPSQSHALHDTLLLASVDGKFHAVSRSTGHALWSMASSPDTTSVSAPHELGALVRTGRTTSRTRSSLKRRIPPKSTIEDEDEEDELQDEGSTSHQQKETYIIEPQSGSIYILSSPSSPLQRFPLTMQELVDISPFTSSIPPPPGAGDAGEQETRVFVGRKETSLILLELETGRVKATLNSECPFVGWEGSAGEGNDDDDAAGEDGERRRRKKHDRDRDQISAPTEVYIGRTGTCPSLIYLSAHLTFLRLPHLNLLQVQSLAQRNPIQPSALVKTTLDPKPLLLNLRPQQPTYTFAGFVWTHPRWEVCAGPT